MMLRYSFKPKFCNVKFLIVAYCANPMFAEIDVFFDLIFTVITLYFCNAHSSKQLQCKVALCTIDEKLKIISILLLC